MGKYISGDDLKGWANYAKGNSYHSDKAQTRHDIGTEGCDQDVAEGMPSMPKQKDSEGQGYAPIDTVTARNTYTSNNGGSKRGD